MPEESPTGSLILMEEDEALSDDDMQSVRSDLLKLLEAEVTSLEPHRQGRPDIKPKAGKGFFRRL